MAVITDLEKEIKAELRAERYLNSLNRYKMIIIAVIIAIVITGSIWALMIWHKHRSFDQASTQYYQAISLLNKNDDQTISPSDQQQAFNSLKKLSSTAPDSIKIFALFQQADLEFKLNHRQQGLDILQQISKNNSFPKEYKTLAELIWIQHQLDHENPKILRQKISNLLAQETPWDSLIKECLALLNLQEGDSRAATQNFGQISSDPNASLGVQQRARLFLQIIATQKNNQ